MPFFGNAEMKTFEKEIQKAQRILDEALLVLRENIECEVLVYNKERYITRFFTKGKRTSRGVKVEIPEEWIEDTSPLDSMIRAELTIFLLSLDGQTKSSQSFS